MNTIYILVSIVIFTLGFLLGRNYLVIRRDNEPDDTSDIVDDVKRTLSKPRARVVSPRAMAEQKAFEKDLSEDIL